MRKFTEEELKTIRLSQVLPQLEEEAARREGYGKIRVKEWFARSKGIPSELLAKVITETPKAVQLEYVQRAAVPVERFDVYRRGVERLGGRIFPVAEARGELWCLVTATTWVPKSALEVGR